MEKSNEKKDKKTGLLDGCEMVVSPKAFESANNYGELSGETVGYSSGIKEMLSLVEELDRYDDFAILKIDTDKYRKQSEGDEYGIEFLEGVHRDGSVIQPHQKNAAADFLKRLRGFGMLADVVGSGKTFEACVVLSELAVRGVVHSMLIVAPAQVYDAWKDTLERFFGLGKGALCEIKTLSDKADGLKFDRVGNWRSPNRPLLVHWEDFVGWSESDVDHVLFDVIVVDEAHHLCDRHGKDANALKLLSTMMQCKKEANKAYCLLLSATPHDGNLENMFPLWYFIDSKGGIPGDFGSNDSDAGKSDAYIESKKRYKDYICHGASTVMDFINRVKREEVCAKYKKPFLDFLRKYKPELCRNSESSKSGISPDFDRLPLGEQFGYVQEFLESQEEVRKNVNTAVALAYHEGILRQIMIRQPNTFHHKKKRVKNYYFYPVCAFADQVDLEIFDVKFRYDCRTPDGNEAVVLGDETKTSVSELARSFKNIGYFQAEYMFNHALMEKFGGCSKEQCDFLKDAAVYYNKQFSALTSYEGSYDISDRLIPVRADSNSFTQKFNKTLEILREHKDQRVLVFFDYALKRDKQLKENYESSYRSGERNICLADKFMADLKKLPEFSSRIICGDGVTLRGDSLEKQFESKQDAILIVTDPSLTEGANLQSCNVIINFQVTTDPLSMDQRIGRVFRIKQENDVTIYSLADMNALEGYVLAYYTRIGLMTSNSGDATIISGSNNEHMVYVRCSKCGSVRLLTQEDYNLYKERDSDVLWCRKSDLCSRDNKRGTLMREMNVHDFQCGTCNVTFSRSREREGYHCIYDDSISMCSNGEKDDRNIYCRKICVMSHCKKFAPGGELADCIALKIYRENGNVGDQDLMSACRDCRLKSICPHECRAGVGMQAIESCVRCHERTEGVISLCTPHILDFSTGWEADCPKCKRGKLRPRIARTFDAFINGLWNYSRKGNTEDTFCATLEKESDKIAEIQSILAMDNFKKG